MKPDKHNYNQAPPTPEFNPEQPHAPEQAPLPESTPEAPQPRPETPIIQPEKDEPQPERRVQPGSSPQTDDQSKSQPTLPPVQQPAQTDSPSEDTTKDDTPLIADDVDVIEKAWVDKAKQIVEDTRDDPHRQEQEVERLQQSYLKKRYGKVVKPSES